VSEKCHPKPIESVPKEGINARIHRPTGRSTGTSCQATRGHSPWPATSPTQRLIGGTTPGAAQSHPGALGVNHQLGSRSEGTGSPRNRDVDSARSRVGRQSQFTLITSNPTEVSGHSSSSMKTRKVCVLITTTCTSIRISRRQLHVEPTEPPFPNQSLNPRVRPTFKWSPHFRKFKHPLGEFAEAKVEP